MLFISWTLCEICLFEFIRVEGGVKFMKLFGGEGGYKSFRTFGLNALWQCANWLVLPSVGLLRHQTVTFPGLGQKQSMIHVRVNVVKTGQLLQ
jgi:hypothetical protein